MDINDFTTWEDLTEEQQAVAVALISCAVIEKMMQGVVECPPELKKELDEVIQQHQLMNLPLYKTAELIMTEPLLDERSVLKRSVLAHAMEAAESAYYYFGQDTVVDLLGGTVIIGETTDDQPEQSSGI